MLKNVRGKLKLKVIVRNMTHSTMQVSLSMLLLPMLNLQKLV